MIFLMAFFYEQEIFVNVAYFIQRPYINDDDAGMSHSYKEAQQLSLLNPAATLQTKQNPSWSFSLTQDTHTAPGHENFLQ